MMRERKSKKRLYIEYRRRDRTQEFSYKTCAMTKIAYWIDTFHLFCVGRPVSEHPWNGGDVSHVEGLADRPTDR